VPVLNLPVGIGTPLARGDVEEAGQRLHMSLVAAERTETGVTVFARGAEGVDGAEGPRDGLPGDSVAVVRCEDLEGRLVGLLDSGGWTAGLGIIERVCPERQAVDVLTPVSEAGDIAAVQVGSLALEPSGRELGSRGRDAVTYL
jgi:polynucleotide 5'-kinase involved in rRNA processing